mmetsp:Transcript_1886/g.5368  ORF Transcript_1886/g.5368 Transcript_1886/m.5368 type:complete len:114 (+) Transcript_1886:30-371(+)
MKFKEATCGPASLAGSQRHLYRSGFWLFSAGAGTAGAALFLHLCFVEQHPQNVFFPQRFRGRYRRGDDLVLPGLAGLPSRLLCEKWQLLQSRASGHSESAAKRGHGMQSSPAK